MDSSSTSDVPPGLDPDLLCSSLQSFLQSSEGFHASIVTMSQGIPSAGQRGNFDTNKLVCNYQISFQVEGNGTGQAIMAVLSFDYHRRRLYIFKRGDHEEVLNVTFVEVVRCTTTGSTMLQTIDRSNKTEVVWPTLVDMGICDPIPVDYLAKKVKAKQFLEFNAFKEFQCWSDLTIYFMGRLPFRIMAANPEQRDNIMERLG